MAEAMITTHQNVKQLTIRLEDKGLLTIERDPANRRIWRLKATPEYHKLWNKRAANDIRTIKEFFEGLGDEEVKNLFEIMFKLEKISLKQYTTMKTNKT